MASTTSEVPIFGRRDADDVDMSPIEFHLPGCSTVDGSKVNYTFHAMPRIPAGYGLDLAVAVDRATGQVPMPAVMSFVSRVLLAQDREAWAEMVHDEEVIVEPEALEEALKLLDSFYAVGRLATWDPRE